VKLFVVTLISAVAFVAQASNFDTLGVTLLRQVDPTLNGSGVKVAQPEGSESTNNPNVFEVIATAVGQPTNLFTYVNSTGGTVGGFPNTFGAGSSHATSVAGNFYGNAPPFYAGIATNIAHVDNYEADYFYNHWIVPGNSIQARVVNQSFNFLPTGQAGIETDYDNYVVSRKTIFVTGGGNNGSINTNPPATCFNGIAVGVTDGTSAVGPTSDGRCKPDIASPGSGVTSFAAPYVSGAAAVLLQAGSRNDGGSSTSSTATNPITIKALLLNGAIKPVDWTNGPTTPLDARYGAGVLNVFNSWNQLRNGKRTFIESTTNTAGNPHPPGSNTGNEVSWIGWDHNTLSTSTSQDAINHYYFNLTGSNSYTFTATLVWNRQQNKSTVNNLDLFLYNAGNGNLVLSSTSAVDNVEHLFLPKLASGRYDLQAMKRGSAGQISTAETYALAFEFFSVNLKILVTNGSAILTWTNAPDGFHLVSASNLNSPSPWTAVNVAVSMTNGQNAVSVPVIGASQFFRLQRP
jgi:hypothetical protein